VGKMETNNYIVIYTGVNKRKQVHVGVIIWIHKSIKNTIIIYTYWIENIFEVKLNIGRRKLSFLDSMSEKKKELKETKTFITKKRKH
jgi:hypothetical protein